LAHAVSAAAAGCSADAAGAAAGYTTLPARAAPPPQRNYENLKFG